MHQHSISYHVYIYCAQRQFRNHADTIIVGHYCAGVLDDGDVMIWHVSVKLPPQKISSPLSGGELQSKGTEICE